MADAYCFANPTCWEFARLTRATYDRWGTVIRKRMADIGLTPLGNKPEQFDAFIKTEIVKWAKVAKASGATAD